MPALTLTYFDIAGGRGEDCRIALHIAGLPFHDDRVQGKDWGARKAMTPYGSLPVLEIEGKGTLAQSNAILRYIGSQHGLHPADPFEAARHEALMEAVEDLRAAVTRASSKDPEEQRRLREALVAGYLKSWGEHIEAQLGEGPFLGGAQLQVADLKLWTAIRWLRRGVLDHVPTDAPSGHPRLERLVEAVQQHPGVVSWYAR